MDHRYYLGSAVELAPGSLVLPVEGGCASNDPDYGAAERLLAERRPEGRIPRSEALVLVADPDVLPFVGAPTDHVYVVETQDAQPHDHSWINVSYFMGLDGEHESAVEAADGYWSGEDFPTHSIVLPTYLARSARVVSRYECDSRQ